MELVHQLVTFIICESVLICLASFPSWNNKNNKSPTSWKSFQAVLFLARLHLATIPGTQCLVHKTNFLHRSQLLFHITMFMSRWAAVPTNNNTNTCACVPDLRFSKITDGFQHAKHRFVGMHLGPHGLRRTIDDLDWSKVHVFLMGRARKWKYFFSRKKK